MLFDKNLFESKYVPAEQRTPVDTLILIGNGFDIWQNLDTSYRSFERYYEAHLDEVLERFHLKKYTKYNDDGTIAIDSEGNTITYSDVELFYGDPFKPQKLDHTFWWNFETSMDKIDDQQINYFFGRDGVKNIKRCAENAQKILKEMFRDWVGTIHISEEISKYNEIRKTAFVPNEEIRQELTTAVESKKWNEMLILQLNSENLLDATLDMDGVAVAEEIEKIHNEHVSVIQYNNENSLSSVLTIAYLSAMQYYFKPIREFPTGRGFAYFVFIPKPEYKNDYPALLVELKWNQNAQTALTQIKTKKYPSSILNYTGDILLVGINYDKKSKEHQCLIEKYEKD